MHAALTGGRGLFFISEGTYHDHVVLGGGLAGDLGEGVGLEAGVEDGIGDLIRKLVGVALVDGLGREEEDAPVLLECE